MLEIRIFNNYSSYTERFENNIFHSVFTIGRKQYILFHEYIQSFSNLISYYCEGKKQFLHKTNLRNLKYYVNKY